MSIEYLKTKRFDMIVVEDNGDAVAYDSDNNIVDGPSTDHDGIIQSAFDGLPASGSPPAQRNRALAFRGFFNMGAAVTFPSYIYVDAYGANFKLTYDGDMFVGDNAGSSQNQDFIQWFGGAYDGDANVRTAGSCFRLASDDSDWTDLRIVDFSDEGFHAETFSGTERTIASRWRDCWFGYTQAGTENEGGGLLFDATGTAGAADNLVDRCYFINNYPFNIKGIHCNWLRVTNSWFAGDSAANTTIGINLVNEARRNIIGPGNIFENHDREAIKIETVNPNFASRNIIIYNQFIDNCKAADNTYDTIFLNAAAGGGGIQNTKIIGNNFLEDTAGAPDPRYHIHCDGTGCVGSIIKNNWFSSGSAATDNIQLDSLTNLNQDNDGDVDWYQTQAGGAWVAPSGNPGNGTRVMVYNSNLGQHRWYVYSNGGWHYETLT